MPPWERPLTKVCRQVGGAPHLVARPGAHEHGVGEAEGEGDGRQQRMRLKKGGANGATGAGDQLKGGADVLLPYAPIASGSAHLVARPGAHEDGVEEAEGEGDGRQHRRVEKLSAQEGGGGGGRRGGGGE